MGPLLLFSCSVMSNSLQRHGLQQASLPCPSSTPRACSDSCPLSRWWHPTILCSVIPVSSCLQSFPASVSFLMSWFFESGGQSIGALASASVLPMSTGEGNGNSAFLPWEPHEQYEKVSPSTTINVGKGQRNSVVCYSSSQYYTESTFFKLPVSHFLMFQVFTSFLSSSNQFWKLSSIFSHQEFYMIFSSAILFLIPIISSVILNSSQVS